jgi:hypothetical protein
MSALDEINRDIWLPFRSSYTTLDLAGFLGFQAPELVRVEAGTGWIGGLDDYGERVGEAFEQAAVRGDRLAIDFRFLERIAGDGVASERGMYRVTVTPADGPAQEFFGRFHTISRCTADGWRFILDYDGDASGPVDAVAFASGHAIEDTQPFER